MMNTISELDGLTYIEHLRKKQRERIMPFSVTFELTPLCNFRCKMCYIRLDKEQLCTAGQPLTTEKWIGIAREARDAGVYRIVFTGGEAFAYPDFRRIYETIFDMGFHITIISNGYLINESAIQWLKRRKPDFIKITLYGASDETYKKVCGIDHGFSTVTSNIRKIRENGISVVTCMTVIQDNNDDIDQVRDWVNKEGIKFVYSKVIRKKVGFARSTPEEVRVPVDIDADVETGVVKHTTDLFAAGNGSPFENCRAYHDTCIIGWDGEVKGCNFISSITVKLEDGKFLDCFKELWKKLDCIKRPEKCKECQYLRFCNPCPGKLEGESGNPEEVSKYVCDFAKWCYYNRNLAKKNDSRTTVDQCDQ